MKFTLQYAAKEIKKRPMEFFPILLISLSVFILIFNMIIFYESQRRTDISYYKLDFEVKLREMPDETAEYIKSLPYVKKVRKVNDYILNIGFEPPYNQSADSIYKAFDRLILDIDLWQYPHYYGYKEIYMQYGFTAFSIESFFSTWFNIPYINSLNSAPMVSAPMLIIIFTGAAAMAAAAALVFNLKLKKNINEYAMLRSLGMTVPDIIKINVFQGIGIMLLCVPFAVGISAAVMKAVCEASHNLYPEIKDNTPLIYTLPVIYIFITVFIITIFSSTALLLVCRLYDKKTVIELINGMGISEIPYVEKSSDKFEKTKDFSCYGKIYRKRTRGTVMTTNILYVSMLILPLIFVYGIFYCINHLFDGYLSPEPKPAYSLSVPYNGQNNVIPESIIEKIRGLDAVTKILKNAECSSADIFTQKGREKEIILLIEDIAEIDNDYISIYEQRVYSEGLIGTNLYVTTIKSAAVDIFICFFFAAQILFLFVSAALIISSVNNFNINKRRSEFAVIRALGETRENIINTVKSSAVINGVIVAAAAVIVTFFFALAADGNTVKTADYIWDYYLSSYFVYIFTFGFMISVNFISSLFAAKKTAGDNLINDIRKF